MAIFVTTACSAGGLVSQQHMQYNLHFVFCRLISAQIANCRGQFLHSSVCKQTQNKVAIDSLNNNCFFVSFSIPCTMGYFNQFMVLEAPHATMGNFIKIWGFGTPSWHYGIFQYNLGFWEPLMGFTPWNHLICHKNTIEDHFSPLGWSILIPPHKTKKIKYFVL